MELLDLSVGDVCRAVLDELVPSIRGSPIIGPLFVCAEIFFLLGAKPQLRRYIEERVGPTVARREHSTAAR